ncbi:sulfite oxidase heme-binding subunit YedZ [Elongatibacter sediminis]|uniref:Protein-methionine-sulfoxide reductase heme-binding subunit MsrQ n=1 Tax=Elongatibacter sediminis TaxID=3119006 RepID=A0AAW9RB08_9GAMM
MNLSPRAVRRLKPVVFLLCLLPLGKLAAETFGVAGTSLGANPIEELLHRCGIWGLNLLLITLAVTPLRRLTRINALIRFRRMLGLFAFFYLVLHFTVYAWLDQGFAWSMIVEDIVERPYITIGIAGLLLLLPLAVTSTQGMMRRLGRRWTQLHRLVYVVGILGVWHFYWQVKQDILEPVIYGLILFALLGFRAVSAWRRRRRTPRNPSEETTDHARTAHPG